jgi:hypothetical protein
MTTKGYRICKTGLALAVSAAFLAGCGGGGGDGPDPIEVPSGVRTVAASAGSDVSAANLQAFSGPLARVVMISTGNSLSSTVATQRESPAAVKAGSGVAAQGLLGYGLGAWTARLHAVREQPAAVETLTEPCPISGSLTITADDRDNDGDVSRGDVMGMTANQCVMDMGTPALNGSFTMTLRQVELDSNRELKALDTDGTMTGLSVGTVGTMDGNLRMRMRIDSPTDQRARVEYTDVVTRFGNESLTYNVDVYSVVSMAGHDHAISGGVGINGQTFQIVPTPGAPFAVIGSGEVPDSGSLRLKDAAGDGLLLRAKAGELIDFEFYPTGATTPSVTLLNQSWDQYRL